MSKNNKNKNKHINKQQQQHQQQKQQEEQLKKQLKRQKQKERKEQEKLQREAEHPIGTKTLKKQENKKEKKQENKKTVSAEHKSFSWLPILVFVGSLILSFALSSYLMFIVFDLDGSEQTPSDITTDTIGEDTPLFPEFTIAPDGTTEESISDTTPGTKEPIEIPDYGFGKDELSLTYAEVEEQFAKFSKGEVIEASFVVKGPSKYDNIMDIENENKIKHRISSDDYVTYMEMFVEMPVNAGEIWLVAEYTAGRMFTTDIVCDPVFSNGRTYVEYDTVDGIYHIKDNFEVQSIYKSIDEYVLANYVKEQNNNIKKIGIFKQPECYDNGGTLPFDLEQHIYYMKDSSTGRHTILAVSFAGNSVFTIELSAENIEDIYRTIVEPHMYYALNILCT